MPTQEFVVQEPGGLYCIGYNPFDPPNSTFGNLNRAVIWETQAAADSAASAIGGGTVGLPKPH